MRSDPVHVDLWRIPLDQAPVATDVLSAEEQAREGRFRFDRDRRRYRAAHVAMRQILAEVTGVPARALTFVHGPQGKPALVGDAMPWFNLSHSDDLAVLAVTTAGPVGVDIEAVRPIPAFDTVAEAHFSSAELAALRALPAAERERGFYRLWTRKEAYIKAIGTGLSHPLDQFTVTLDAETPRYVDIEGDVARAACWALTALPLEAPYVGAVTLEASAMALATHRWTMAATNSSSRPRT